MEHGSPTKGKVKEELGFLTGDRKVEAEGKAEQAASGRGEEPEPEEVEETEERVRRQHGDIR